MPDPFNATNRDQIIALAAHYGVPAIYNSSYYAQPGGLIAYGEVNHLRYRSWQEPEEILARLERGDFSEDDIDNGAGRASDNTYEERVRNIEAATPARFNADPGCLYEASGCAGKLAVFAVRLDTFPKRRAKSSITSGRGKKVREANRAFYPSWDYSVFAATAWRKRPTLPSE